jgi:hypothetical protein
MSLLRLLRRMLMPTLIGMSYCHTILFRVIGATSVSAIGRASFRQGVHIPQGLVQTLSVSKSVADGQALPRDPSTVATREGTLPRIWTLRHRSVNFDKFLNIRSRGLTVPPLFRKRLVVFVKWCAVVCSLPESLAPKGVGVCPTDMLMVTHA